MNDIQRMVGAWEEFREWERTEHAKLDARLVTIETKLDEIRLARALHRGKIIGISTVVSALISALGVIVAHFLR